MADYQNPPRPVRMGTLSDTEEEEPLAAPPALSRRPPPTAVRAANPNIQRMATLEGEGTRTSASDVLGIGGSQLAEAIVGLGELAGIEGAAESNAARRRDIERQLSTLSPQLRRKLEADVLSAGEGSMIDEGFMSSLYYKVLQQVPGLAVTMAPGIGVGARGALAGRAALAAGDVAGAAAATANAGRIAGVAGGALEGLQAGGAAKSNMVGILEMMPPEELAATPVYQRLAQQMPGADPEAIRRRAMAEVGNLEAVTAGVVTSLLGGLSQRYIGRVIAGGSRDATLARAQRSFLSRRAEGGLRGAAVEGGTEALQSGQEQVATNIGVGRPGTLGVAEASAQGGLIGMAIGGPLGTLERSRGSPSAAPPEAIPGRDQVAGYLPPPQGKLNDPNAPPNYGGPSSEIGPDGKPRVAGYLPAPSGMPAAGGVSGVPVGDALAADQLLQQRARSDAALVQGPVAQPPEAPFQPAGLLPAPPPKPPYDGPAMVELAQRRAVNDLPSMPGRVPEEQRLPAPGGLPSDRAAAATAIPAREEPAPQIAGLLPAPTPAAPDVLALDQEGQRRARNDLARMQVPESQRQPGPDFEFPSEREARERAEYQAANTRQPAAAPVAPVAPAAAPTAPAAPAPAAAPSTPPAAAAAPTAGASNWGVFRDRNKADQKSLKRVKGLMAKVQEALGDAVPAEAKIALNGRNTTPFDSWMKLIPAIAESARPGAAAALETAFNGTSTQAEGALMRVLQSLANPQVAPGGKEDAAQQLARTVEDTKVTETTKSGKPRGVTIQEAASRLASMAASVWEATRAIPEVPVTAELTQALKAAEAIARASGRADGTRGAPGASASRIAAVQQVLNDFADQQLKAVQARATVGNSDSAAAKSEAPPGKRRTLTMKPKAPKAEPAQAAAPAAPAAEAAPAPAKDTAPKDEVKEPEGPAPLREATRAISRQTTTVASELGLNLTRPDGTTRTPTEAIKEDVAPDFNDRKWQLANGIWAQLKDRPADRDAITTALNAVGRAVTPRARAQAVLDVRNTLAGMGVPKPNREAFIELAGRWGALADARRAEEAAKTERDSMLPQDVQDAEQMARDAGLVPGTELFSAYVSQLMRVAVADTTSAAALNEMADTILGPDFAAGSEVAVEDLVEMEANIPDDVDPYNPDDLFLQAPASTNAATAATRAMRTLVQSMMAKNQDISSRALLQRIESVMGDHALKPLVRALLRGGIDVPVQFRETGEPNRLGTQFTRTRADGSVYSGIGVNSGELAMFPSAEQTERFLHTVLHELVHVSTRARYMHDAGFRGEVDALLKAANEAATQRGANTRNRSKFYGLTNAIEFMAEAMTNREFKLFLSTVDAPKQFQPKAKRKSLLQRFMDLVRSVLGLPANDRSLDVLSVSEKTITQKFMDARDLETWHEWLASDSRTLKLKDAPLMSFQQSMDTIREAVSTGAQTTTDWLRGPDLGLSNYDQMEREYRSIFDKAGRAFKIGNPLARFVDARNRAAGAARAFVESAAPIFERAAELSKEAQLGLGLSMRDSTMAGVFVDGADPLNDQRNARVLQSKIPAEAAAGRAAIAQFAKLKREHPAAAQLYTELLNEVESAYAKWRSEALNHVADAHQLSPATRKLLVGAADPAGLAQAKKAMIAGGMEEQDASSLVDAAKKLLKITELPGPYFPLRRDGQYVAVAGDPSQPQVFIMAGTRAEAHRLAKAEGLAPGSYFVTRKLESDTASVDLRATVQSISGKVTDPKLQAQLQDALIKMLGQNILYSTTMQRKNVRGVQAAAMLPAARDYISSLSYSAGHLKTALQQDAALKQMSTLTREDSTGRLSEDERVVIGQVRAEISKRLEESSLQRESGQVERAVGALGFYNYLGAPSFWLLQLAQTVTMGVPVLAGRTDQTLAISAAGMSRAWGVVNKAIGTGRLRDRGKRMLDLKALANALPPEYGNLVRWLDDQNVLGNTLSQEFGSLLSGSDFLMRNGAVRTVSKILQNVPQAIEYFNRVTSAIAAYDLQRGDIAAKRQAALDVLQESQINYSPENRARLMKSLPGGGGGAIVRPIMMFKLFGVSMFRLLYGNMYKAMLGKTPAERQAARRVFGGLIAAHTLFGGVFGGLGIGMVQLMGAALNGLLDDEDEIQWGYEVDRFVADATNEYVARIVTQGVPAAVGMGMSNSFGLGNLLWMSSNTELSERGGAETKLVEQLGPIVGYGMHATRTVAKYVDSGEGFGDAAHTLAQITPLKWVRELDVAAQGAMNGLRTQNDQEFMSPEQIGVWQTFLGASLGVRSAAQAQRREVFYAERGRSVTLEQKKSDLMARHTRAENTGDRLKAQRAIQVWNKKMAERGNQALIISPDSLATSAESMKRVRDEYKAGQFTQYR